jgi:penicillin-binding protein 1C
MKTKLKEVPPELIESVIRKEDRWFYWHPGFNPVSVLKAFINNTLSGERVSGASTITMQLARMLEPAERTYLNKMLEIIRAVQLELHYSKDEILEMYLSVLPMGGNIEGVKAASYIYFNRPPDKLSLAQCILFTVIPNDPNLYRIDRPVDNVLRKRNFWIHQFLDDEVFDPSLLADAVNEDIVSNRYAIPKRAPHFCRVVRQNYKESVVRTSLDASAQAVSQNLLYNHVERIKGKGITNGAVLVIENKTGSVAAYCGSADFYDEMYMGQVNGVTAVRSPGSALKPFLYAQALNSGDYTPRMKLYDIPTDFGSYSPENYNPVFNGDVTIEFALVNSLNVPAVRLLRQQGCLNFVNLLANAGFTSIEKNKRSLGLSVVLGGCGVTLEELVRFYSVFPNGGRLRKINYILPENETENGRYIFNEAAAYIISEILSGNERPDFPNILSAATKLPRIAWKTGTSYGRRDGWAVGYNPKYTIGVWTGNFDGKGSPELSGAEIAVPLLFELFNALDYNPEKEWFDFPEDLKTRKVCAESGLINGAFCTNLVNDYYILNVSHSRKCELTKEIFTDSSGSVQYCYECLPDKGYIKSAAKYYDPELKLWYEENNISYDVPPPHNINCTAVYDSDGPRIISPSEEFDYYIEEGSDQQIKLLAASDAGTNYHYWYINDIYFNKSDPDESLYFTPRPGKNIIQCVDDKGRSSLTGIIVNSY